MEFFAEIIKHTITADKLHDVIIIERLPEFCASINSVVAVQSPVHGEIYCLWGQFPVSLTKILNGVRLAFINCPHALALTITTHKKPDVITLHCTIDDQEADAEFIESIKHFINDWVSGLNKLV